MATNRKTTDSIILKKIPYGESDLIVTFFGYDDGKMTGFAPRAAKSSKRFGGALDIGSLSRISFIQKNSEMVRLEEATNIVPLLGMKKSLKRIAAASYALELAEAFLQPHQASHDKFELLSKFLGHCNDFEPNEMLIASFEIKILALSGYKPSLGKCVICGNFVEKKEAYFLYEHGGVVCEDCKHPQMLGDLYPKATFAVVEKLLYTPMIDAAKRIIPKNIEKSVNKLLDAYINRTLNKDLKSKAFLKDSFSCIENVK
ncbi:DNA repair protein RecO [bacterium]|nr:DNA repair protein RecO [bacterium]